MTIQDLKKLTNPRWQVFRNMTSFVHHAISSSHLFVLQTSKETFFDTVQPPIVILALLLLKLWIGKIPLGTPSPFVVCEDQKNPGQNRVQRQLKKLVMTPPPQKKKKLLKHLKPL